MLWELQVCLLCIFCGLLVAALPRRLPYTLVDKWGERGKGRGEFAQAHGICLDLDGNLLITDSGRNQVYRFTRSGALIGELNAGTPPACGGAGLQTTGGQGFHGPRDVAVDAAGNIFVVDGTWGRILRFNRDGNVVAQWGEKGSGPGQFLRPHAIAIGLEGRIYAADVDNGRVQVYDPLGEFLFQWGERGTGPGQFLAPHGVAPDPSGGIFVCEYDGRRCQKFTPDGNHLATFAVIPEEEKLTYHAMASDRHGNAYFIVRDRTYERSAIAKYDDRGEFITSFALPPEPGRLFMPNCAAIDEEGRVYVTDKGRSGIAIYVFAPGE